MLVYLLGILETEDDKSLLLKIYNEYSKIINFIAIDGLDNLSNVDDCVQETFVELIKSFESFKKVSNEKRKPYIIRICKRVIYRMNNANPDTVSYEENTDDNYSDESEFDFSEYDRTDMAIVIKDLDPLYREPLLLKYSSGFSGDEISKILGISTNLVYQRIHRGKIILHSILTGE